MVSCLVVGMTNAGKTLFTLNFARYLGVQELAVSVTTPGGEVITRHYEIMRAIKELCSPHRHYTQAIQEIKVKFRHRKMMKELKFVDTAGLCCGIHPRAEIRAAIADTLDRLLKAEYILHIIDASAVGRQGMSAVSEVDVELIRFGHQCRGYLILANKMDILEARRGLSLLRESFPGETIIPISALKRSGFGEVRAVVSKFN